jgi:hypothetical protein
VIRVIVPLALLALGGCTGLIAAGSAAGAIGGGLAIASQVADSVDTTIRTACGEYEKGRVVADAILEAGLLPPNTAAKVRTIEEYGDAVCAAPPSGNTLSTAIWLGKLIGQIVTLTGDAPAT